MYIANDSPENRINKTIALKIKEKFPLRLGPKKITDSSIAMGR
jgi:hypothetical protein